MANASTRYTLVRVATLLALVALAALVAAVVASGVAIALFTTPWGHRLTDLATAPGDYTGYGGLMLIIFAAAVAFFSAFVATLIIGRTLISRIAFLAEQTSRKKSLLP